MKLFLFISVLTLSVLYGDIIFVPTVTLEFSVWPSLIFNFPFILIRHPTLSFFFSHEHCFAQFLYLTLTLCLSFHFPVPFLWSFNIFQKFLVHLASHFIEFGAFFASTFAVVLVSRPLSLSIAFYSVPALLIFFVFPRIAFFSLLALIPSKTIPLYLSPLKSGITHFLRRED